MADKDIKIYVLNLGKLGVPTEVISNAVDKDIKTIEEWLSAEGVDPNSRRNELRKRQTEGIAAAKAKGVKFGRPKVTPPENFGNIIKAWEDKKLSAADAMELCGMKEATFYRRVREYRLGQLTN